MEHFSKFQLMFWFHGQQLFIFTLHTHQAAVFIEKSWVKLATI